jgi:leucyl/phenylalanyl-tRNA--protein transferase
MPPPVLEFPPVELADEDGLLAIGGDCHPQSLLLAYRSGIFPWPINEESITWFAPPIRGVIFLDSVKISKSLRRELKLERYTVRRNHQFSEVIARCSELKNRGDQNGTWIIPEIIAGYTELHRLGYAHSFESYFEGELVGGLYGVQIGRYFSGESSFYRMPNASKVAMVALLAYLIESGITWLDCQTLTPFAASFGAVEITRAQYMEILRRDMG